MSAEVAKALGEMQALSAMRDGNGWRIYGEVFDQEVIRLNAKIFDPKTPASEAEILRQLRAKLVREY